MRRCVLAFMLFVAAVVGLAPVARAAADPVSTWYEQVAAWRTCVHGVIAGAGTFDTAKTQCGERPAPPADPRLDHYRQAIKDWRICVREQLAKGVHGDALRAVCAMPKPSDFGLPSPPEPPKPAWVEPYRRAQQAWEDCIHAQRAAGHPIDEARAACGAEPTPDQFGGPAKPLEPSREVSAVKPPATSTVAPGDHELATKPFRICVEREMKVGAAIRDAFQTCKDQLPPGVELPPIVKNPPTKEPRPLEPATSAVTEPKHETTTTLAAEVLAARFRRCLEERTQQGLTPDKGYASCLAHAPKGFVPPPPPG